MLKYRISQAIDPEERLEDAAMAKAIAARDAIAEGVIWDARANRMLEIAA